MTTSIGYELATGSSTGGIPQPDPDLSLSGKRSTTRLEEVESTLTAVSGTTPRSVFTDETQETGFGVPPDPPSGATTRPDQNSGNYGSASNLLNWWRIAYDPTNDPSFTGITGLDQIGSNPVSATAGGPVLYTTDQPGTMWNQRASVTFAQDRMNTPGQSTLGLTTELSITAWVRSTFNGGSRAHTIFAIHDSLASSGPTTNFLRLQVGRDTGGNDNLNPGQPSLFIRDASGTDTDCQGDGSSLLSTNTWYHLCWTVDLDAGTVALYIDGTLQTLTTDISPASSALTLDSVSRYAILGSLQSLSWDWAGQIHSVCLWDSVLGATEVAALAGFGDGAEPAPPPVVDHLGKWLSFHTPGTNRDQAREIIDFDDSTGTYTVAEDLPADAQVSDAYRLWPPNGVFSAFDFDQSVRRTQKVRLTFGNFQAGTISNYRLWVVPIDPGPLVCEVAQGTRSGGEQTTGGVTDEEDEPSLSYTSPALFNQNLDFIDRFQRAASAPAAEFLSPLGTNQINNGNIRPIFLKLSFRPGEPLPLFARCIFQVFTGDEGGTISGSFLVVADVNGADEELILGPDRALRLKAGARVQALVRDRATGTPVPNKTVTIEQTAGPGTLGAQSSDVTDDSGNPVRATYISPTDEVEVGEDVTFQVEVN